MAKEMEGNCYICGATLGKIAMKNHILKLHNESAGTQECYLLKIEGRHSKDYWLYIDLPVTKTLAELDDFLKAIWLECCGHMSAFYPSGYDEIKKSSKLGSFAEASTLRYEYDFGSTTELLITFVAKIKRARRRETIRLLGRNVPPQFTCQECGNPADYICTECMYDMENPYYCENCSGEHDHEDMLLPITNSPRMGVCAYEGDLDVFGFDAALIASKKE